MGDQEWTAARQALDRGDYRLALKRLEELAPRQAASSPDGARLRLWMATAWMGLGESQRASACCREAQRCPDPSLRAQARELLLILEAPALRRPREWSLTLPDLAEGQPLEQLRGGARGGRTRDQPPPSPPPPVGPTKAPLGFAALTLVLVVMLLLSALLGGCMEIRSELHFDGPGRLQIRHQLRPSSGVLAPWQQRLAEGLHDHGFRDEVGSAAAELRLSTPVLPARQALEALADSLELGAQLAGVVLPPASLRWSERNWWLGVSQMLEVQLDLSGLADLPGVDLSLQMEPVNRAAARLAQPNPVQRRGAALIWPLATGTRNTLRLQCWRWSPLGLGSVLIALALLLSLVLQRIRLRLGYGPPQLPA